LPGSSSKPTIYVESASSYNKDKKPTIYIKSASSCNKTLKPTISIKSASSYNKHKKLTELSAIIKGISYPSLESIPVFQTKGASFENNFNRPGPIEREVKLKALAKIIRGE
jgi:hypothetical protein